MTIHSHKITFQPIQKKTEEVIKEEKKKIIRKRKDPFEEIKLEEEAKKILENAEEQESIL